MRQSPYKWIGIEKVKKEETLKWYKEKYDQMIKDKEEYMKNFLERLGNMDLFWITEEKKEDVMLRMEKDMKKEIEWRKK